jgi:glucose-6-phosphate dehydrogenase assembly protein OpcA
MTNLRDTNGSAVAAAIAAERQRIGASTTGMVLTLLVVAGDDNVQSVVADASWAAREHPMRIIVLVPHGGRVENRIDARILVGGDHGPGETVVLWLRGEVAGQPGSVATPLLLPDTPVVVWWAGDAPDAPAMDQVGRHAHRRITDATVAEEQVRVITARANGYQAGDTDIAWGELTGWRALLASAFDEPYDTVHSATINAPKDTWAAAGLLAAWLHQRLHIPVAVAAGSGPGISTITITTAAGDIVISRSDGKRAQLSRPGRPDAVLALPHRSKAEVLAEELRRLDADEIYAEALTKLSGVTFEGVRR